MRAFTYEKVSTPAEAATRSQQQPGAKFIAGGTNLLDLMKLETETPVHLIDVNGWLLMQLKLPRKGACVSGRWYAIRTSPLICAFASTTPC